MTVNSKSVATRGWEWYLEQLRTRPIPTKALTSCILSILSDLFAQIAIEGRLQKRGRSGSPLSGLAWERTLRFAIFGLLASCVTHTWYLILDGVFNPTLVKNLRISLGSTSINIAPLVKLLFDQSIFAPSINVFFFAVMAILEGQPQEIKTRIVTQLWPTLKTSWKVWPLAQYINFNFVPPHLRVLFGNVVSFFWSVYLTIINNKAQKKKVTLTV